MSQLQKLSTFLKIVTLLAVILGTLVLIAVKSGLFGNLGLGREEGYYVPVKNNEQFQTPVGTYRPRSPEVAPEQMFIEVEPPKDFLYLATTENLEDLYIGHDQPNGLKFLHKERKNYQATTTYPVERAYPGSFSNEAILEDYIARLQGGGAKLWFGKRPGTNDEIPQNALLSENLFAKDESYMPVLPEWLLVPVECFAYMPQENCNFAITNANPYGLTAATLTKEIGPYEWPGSLTPYEAYVTSDKKVLLLWGFGDAGAYAKYVTLWDPANNTHVFLNSVSGMMEEVSSLSLPNKMYEVSLSDSYSGYATTTPSLKLDPFKGVKIYGESLLSHCYSVSFHPTNILDESALWLVEYEYLCGEDGWNIKGLSVWYSLDPVTDTVVALTGVIPK